MSTLTTHSRSGPGFERESPSSQSHHRDNHPTPFDIDTYLNPYIPRSPLHLLPKSISHFFGYRPPRRSPSSPSAGHRFHNTIIYTSVFIGTFCGLSIIENVFLALPPLSGHTVPIIIASFGAAAILEYNSIESPLAQPRNLIFGHFLSALVAVSITKLFEHLPPQRFDDLRWLAGAISVGAASMLMSATKTVHPPAGATALLASTTVEIQVLGWWLLPLVLLASSLMLVSAMLLNNLAGRRYPVYWWTPVDLKALKQERQKARVETKNLDIEKEANSGCSSSSTSAAPASDAMKDEALSDEDTEVGSHVGDLRKLSTQDTHLGRSLSFTSASRIAHPMREPKTGSNMKDPSEKQSGEGEQVDRIVVSRDGIIVPDWLELNDWEDEVLRILLERLRDA